VLTTNTLAYCVYSLVTKKFYNFADCLLVYPGFQSGANATLKKTFYFFIDALSK
jgi:hypothetical protein